MVAEANPAFSKLSDGEFVDGNGEFLHGVGLLLGWALAAVVTIRPILTVEVHQPICRRREEAQLVRPAVAVGVVLELFELITTHIETVGFEGPFDGAETHLDDRSVVFTFGLKIHADLDESVCHGELGLPLVIVVYSRFVRGESHPEFGEGVFGLGKRIRHGPWVLITHLAVPPLGGVLSPSGRSPFRRGVSPCR